MKTIRSLLLVLSLGLMFSACRSMEPTKPDPTAKIPAATKIPEIDSAPTPVPSASLTPPASPESGTVVEENGKIRDFEEGKLLQEADVPEVVRAVTERFPKAVIKSIVYALHEGAEVYRVTMDGADSTEVYISPSGEILGPKATPMQGSVGDTDSTPAP